MKKYSRREWVKRGLGGAALLAGCRIMVGAPQVDVDLALTNGKFVDSRGVVGTRLTIRNGRIVNVGQNVPLGPGARTVNLGGRTVVPGFFDAHVHYTRAGVNPGYEARRIERAFSIVELQEAIARRAESVPSGQFITCIGGWNHTQFAEARRPTKADLDAANMPSIFQVREEALAPSPTASDKHSFLRRASPSTHQRESLQLPMPPSRRFRRYKRPKTNCVVRPI
jgi:hypothetical protein